MKKITKLLSLILTVVMLVGITSTANAAQVTFTDVANHWAWTQGQIPYLVEKNVLNGYKQNNGTYKFLPDGEVKRGEFIKMLDETFGLVATAPINYADVKTNDWFYPYFQKAAAQGYILNYGTNANPNSKLTREEAFSLLIRYLDLPASSKASSSQFTDFTKINPLYRDYILQAEYIGMANGYKQNDGTYQFKPQNTLKRGEALTILYRAAGCIFDKSTSVRDTGAGDTNNVITKSDIVLAGIKFNGRNIISEGANSGKITFTGCTFNDTLYIRGNASVSFDNCTIKDIVVYGNGAISLHNGSSAKSVTLSSSNAITLYSGTKIETLNVGTTATNVTVSGAGALDTANINARGFVSSILPDEFEIANNLTAVFAGETYQGSSENQSTFKLTPFSTRDNSKYYINVKPMVNGRLYLYYTNDSTTPSATKFDYFYESSNYATNFKVTAGTTVTEETISANLAEDFSYVVLQIQDGTRKYAPVVISNNAAVGTGFSTDPYLENLSKIKLKTNVAGKLYWFYADEGDSLSVMEFVDLYNAKETALRGEETVSASKDYTFSLKTKYLENYDYVAFMLVGSGNTYYKPVVVSVADSGFTELPAVTSPGIISFKTDVSGEIYYYYSKDGSVPTAENFNAEYRKVGSVYSDVVDAIAGRTGEIRYNTLLTVEYPYLIMAIRTSSREFLQPVAVSVDYDTGFASNPEILSGTEIRFKSRYDGDIYYYYTTSAAAPNSSEFTKTFDKMAKKYRGTKSVTEKLYGYIDYDSYYAEDYGYMAFMLIDENGKNYSPIVLKLDILSASGFTTEPYLTDGYLSFKTNENGEVFYYLTNDSNPVTAADFYSNYQFSLIAGTYGTSIARKDTAGSIKLNATALKENKYIVVAFLPWDGEVDQDFSFPIILETSSSTSSSLGSGISFWQVWNNENAVHVETNLNCVIYYYLTDSTSELPTGTSSYASFEFFFTRAKESNFKYVNNSYISFPHNDYKYAVVCVYYGGQYLTPIIIDVKRNAAYDGEITTPTPPTTTPDAGTSTPTIQIPSIAYTQDDLMSFLTNYSLSLTPANSGTLKVTFTASNLTQGELQSITKEVTVGQLTTIDLTHIEQFLKMGVLRDVTAHFQLTSGTAIYAPVSIKLN